MKHVNKTLRTLSAGIIAAAVFSNGVQAQSAAKPNDPVKIRLGLSGGLGEGLGYRVAKSLGYFKEEGLEVEETHIESRTLARDAVANGQVDITNTGLTTSLRAIEQGRPVRVVSGIISLLPVYIVASPEFLKKHNVQTAQFKSWTPEQRLKFLVDGKARWASSIPGSVIDFVSQNQLRHFGIEAQRDLSIQYFPSPNQAVDSFSQGKSADVLLTAETYIVRLATLVGEKNFEDLPLVLSRQQISEILPSSLVPGEQWIANIDTAKPEALTRFLKAYLRGVEYFYGKSPAEVTQLILKDNPDVTSEKARESIQDAVSFSYRVTPRDGKLTSEQVKAGVGFALEQKQIKAPLDVSKIVDSRFIEAAAGQLPKRGASR